jgi:hypothetical protein
MNRERERSRIAAYEASQRRRQPASEQDIDKLTRRALRHIRSFHLEDLPERIDSKGTRHAAEYNDDVVRERIEATTIIELREILGMTREEFREAGRRDALRKLPWSPFYYH